MNTRTIKKPTPTNLPIESPEPTTLNKIIQRLDEVFGSPNPLDIDSVEEKEEKEEEGEEGWQTMMIISFKLDLTFFLVTMFLPV